MSLTFCNVHVCIELWIKRSLIRLQIGIGHSFAIQYSYKDVFLLYSMQKKHELNLYRQWNVCEIISVELEFNCLKNESLH